MIPGRRAGDDLQPAGGDAERLQQRERVGLDVEDAHGALLRRPMAAGAGGQSEAAAQSGGGDLLALLVLAQEDLTDLEQSDIGKAARGVAAGRGREAGQQARPHVGELGGDRIGEREAIVVAAPNSLRLLLRDEGPGDGLHQTARGERAARGARALLQQGENRLGDARVARQGRGGDIVEADDAGDLLDEIGLALYVRAPCAGRSPALPLPPLRPRSRDG